MASPFEKPCSEENKPPLPDKQVPGPITRGVFAATIAAILYSAVAVIAFAIWLRMRTRGPSESIVLLSSCLCVCIAGLVGLFQGDRFREIVFTAFIAVCAGYFLGPTSSSHFEGRLQRILSGYLFEFKPALVSFWAFIGTVIGQNLRELRIALAHMDNRAPKI